MLESKAGKVRKAGGKDVCAGICVAGRERNVKGGSDRVRERNERKNASERTRVRKQREETQEYRSTRRHAHVHSANTRKYIQIHTRDIYETQRHAILYIYDSIDDGAAHSHSVSRIVPQNFSFEFASRNLLFSNV